MAGGQRAKLFAPAIEKWLPADHEPVSSHLEQTCKDRVEVAFAARLQDIRL